MIVMSMSDVKTRKELYQSSNFEKDFRILPCILSKFCKNPLIYPFDSVSPGKLDKHIFVNCMCTGDTFIQVLICTVTMSEWT